MTPSANRTPEEPAMYRPDPAIGLTLCNAAMCAAAVVPVVFHQQVSW
jgi:hypothetical protein